MQIELRKLKWNAHTLRKDCSDIELQNFELEPPPSRKTYRVIQEESALLWEMTV